MKTCFLGTSGKMYIKNPFDNGRYCYAVYDSPEAYANMAHLPTYVAEDVAKSDFKIEIAPPVIISKHTQNQDDDK